MSTQRIHIGVRGTMFNNLIKNLLIKGGLNTTIVDKFTNASAMGEYNAAFTSKGANKHINLEVYEQLGDVSVNKFIVWHMYRRFPKLHCPEGVKIVARLRINYGSKQSLYKIADKLGFWDYITATTDERYRAKKSLLEDTFEAFIGCTEFLIDQHHSTGIGYNVVSKILSSIFDDIHISLRYYDLYDSKTILKEIFDAKKLYHIPLGTICYKDSSNGDCKQSKVFNNLPTGMILLGEGSGTIKSNAQEQAAKNAIAYLSTKGICKHVPTEYTELIS